MTVLPSLISVNDIGSGELVVNPIVDPPLHAEFVVIEPARRPLSTQARLFLQHFEAEIADIQMAWELAMAVPISAGLDSERDGPLHTLAGAPG